MIRSCETCEWWESSGGAGACHGGPPSATADGDGCMWPITEPDAWCGAWRLAEWVIRERYEGRAG